MMYKAKPTSEFIQGRLYNCHVCVSILIHFVLHKIITFRFAKALHFVLPDLNLYVSLSHLFSINDYKKELISQIKAIDLSYDENRDLVKLFYQNGDKRAHASLQDIENILPIITLDDSLKAKDSQLPDWDELHKFTDTLLEKIKKQIGYTPKEI